MFTLRPEQQYSGCMLALYVVKLGSVLDTIYNTLNPSKSDPRVTEPGISSVYHQVWTSPQKHICSQID